MRKLLVLIFTVSVMMNSLKAQEITSPDKI